MRPLTLLDIIGKSLTALEIITHAVLRYISSGKLVLNQVEAHLTYRWLAAKYNVTQGLKFHITGMDMSVAFSNKLLYILSHIVNEDGLRITRFLLSNTVINMKINGATEQHSFTANTGTHQGDALSPAFSIVYLENVLRNVRFQPEHEFLPPEVAYADDVDRDVDDFQAKVQLHQLNVNTDKTEYTGIQRQSTRHDESWRSRKKSDDYLVMTETLKKTLSTTALSKLNAVWLRQDKSNLNYTWPLSNQFSCTIVEHGAWLNIRMRSWIHATESN